MPRRGQLREAFPWDEAAISPPGSRARVQRLGGHRDGDGYPRNPHVSFAETSSAPQVRQAAQRRLATLASPAVVRLEQLMKQNENPSVALSAVKEILERNGLDAIGKPQPANESTLPPIKANTVNIGAPRFDELSDEGLDLVERLLKGIMEQTKDEVIDVPKEPTKFCGSRPYAETRQANRLINAAEVLRSLTPIGVTSLPESHARELAALPPEDQRAVYQFVKGMAPDGKVTQRHLKSVVSVVHDVMVAGAVDDGTGEMMPWDKVPAERKAGVDSGSRGRGNI
jgi:hypothetical protein